MAYIPMPKGRGFTPRLVIPDVPRVHRQQCLPQRLQMGLRDEYFQLAIGEIRHRRSLRKYQLFAVCFQQFYYMIYRCRCQAALPKQSFHVLLLREISYRRNS